MASAAPQSTPVPEIASRSPAVRAAAAYMPAYRASSAAWPRTPSQLVAEKQPDYAVHGQRVPQHITRGQHVGHATPRHLQSSVGDIIFSGGAWGMPATRDAKVRGDPEAVGAARLHEVGHLETPCGTSRFATSRMAEADHVFGEPPPERPTVGTRSHLSRSHLHTRSELVAASVMFASDLGAGA